MSNSNFGNTASGPNDASAVLTGPDGGAQAQAKTSASGGAAVSSPALSWPKAVAATGEYATVAAHYGDPLREQRLLEEGLGAVDLSARGVVTVTGPDRLSWLHSMTTQDLLSVKPFESTETLVLSPHGHIEFDLHLVDDGETAWITVDPGKQDDLVAFLNKMKFMLRVDVRDVTDEYAVIGEPLRQPSTADEKAQRGVIAWVDPWPALGPDTASYSQADVHPGESWKWRELIVPRDRFVEEFGERQPVGLWAFTAYRVAAWRPDGLAEVDHRTIPHELDWLRTAVHLHKGCYRGQETIARVHNLGRPPRRLAFVDIDGSEHTLPEVGADVFVVGNDRPVGRLTSVARHYVDGPIGLVVIKRNVPVDAQLLIAGTAAAQTPIVQP